MQWTCQQPAGIETAENLLIIEIVSAELPGICAIAHEVRTQLSSARDVHAPTDFEIANGLASELPAFTSPEPSP
jgi:hypothetical protein